MSQEEAKTGAIKKRYDTRLSRRTGTAMQIPIDTEEAQLREIGNIRTTLTGQEDVDNIKNLGTRLEECGKTKTSYHGSIHSRSFKSKTSSKSVAEMRKMEVELEAERKIVEMKENLIRKQLEFDKLRIDEESNLTDRYGSEGASEVSVRSDDLGKSTDKNMMINNWIKESAQPFRKCSDDNLLNRTDQLENDNVRISLRRQSLDRKLPYFDGNPAEWLVFINEYHETTQLCHYSASENLIRLRNCLKGEARKSVKMLLISYKNVSEILETLETLYGKPEYIIKNLIFQVRKTSPPRDYKPETIIRYANVINNLVITIKHLDQDVYLKNPILLEEFVSHLTINLKLQWSMFAVKLTDVSLLTFSSWLKEVGKAATLLCDPSTQINQRVQKRFEPVLVAEGRRERTWIELSRRNCYCCENERHNLEKCTKFKEMDVDNRWNLITKKRLCISCLKPNHHLNSCRYIKDCAIDNCRLKHNPLLHKNFSDHQTRGNERNAPNEDSNEQLSEEISCVHQARGPKVMLRTVPVILEGPCGKIEIYALLDEGSTVTLLEEEIANHIGLKGKTESLCMQWTNSHTQTYNSSQRVEVQIRGTFLNAKNYTMTNVRTINGLNLPPQSLDIDYIKYNWPYLKDIPVKSFQNVTPKILIGTDNYDLIMPRNFVEDSRHGPKATLSKLGWVINGLMVKNKVNGTFFNLHICEKNYDDDLLHLLVKDSFRIDNSTVQQEKMLSKEDENAMKIIEATTKRVGDRFETGLLWRNENIVVPESKTMALTRLYCQEMKMDKNIEFGKAYCKKIEEYIRKGYLRQLSKQEALEETDKTWYLPHFAVFNPNKPGKLRMVFDAAAKSHGLSLNDLLFQGPNLMTNLVQVLWTFRLRKIAFCGDIREMFHQVLIREEDRSSQRLLWRGFDRNREPDVLEMQVMTFGACCSPCLAQYVKNKNAEEFQQQFPKASQAITRKHYVDDYLDSCDTEKEAMELIEQVIYVHKKGGFEICNWISNSKSIMNSLPEELRLAKLKEFHSDVELPVERVLGLYWNAEEDIFSFDINFFKIKNQVIENLNFITKRQILKVIMSIFDPLGFLNNIVIQGRINRKID